MVKIILCGKARCCPTIEKVGDDEFHIVDDYMNRVIMTEEQLQELVDKYDRGEIY